MAVEIWGAVPHSGITLYRLSLPVVEELQVSLPAAPCPAVALDAIVQASVPSLWKWACASDTRPGRI